jgi:hypothetical protein
MTRLQHLAAGSRVRRGHDATDNDGFAVETFTLPLEAARRKVRIFSIVFHSGATRKSWSAGDSFPMAKSNSQCVEC